MTGAEFVPLSLPPLVLVAFLLLAAQVVLSNTLFRTISQ